jgi:xanthine dehydrogenase accessory factor
MEGRPPHDGEVAQLASRARAWLDAGHGVALATVVSTWGSAPRRQGSHLIIRDDGTFEGSVSGGCVEGDVITEAAEVIGSGQFRRLEYGVANETAWRVGLACGGRISVLLQPIGHPHFPAALLDRLVVAQRAGEPLMLVTDLGTGQTREMAAGETPSPEGAFVNHYPPPLRLAVVGAVHIAQSLVPLARSLGYSVTVIDPRELFATAQRFEGVPLDRRWPDEALDAWQPNAASAVVALTHDPKLDDAALRVALSSPAFYIGALGSSRSHLARVERLAAAGIDPQLIERIRGPAGLPIGAANPPEIALSIAAEMVAAWRKASPEPRSRTA